MRDGLVRRDLADLQATASLAGAVAERLRPGDAVLLEGPFGAGKTEFARQMLRRLTHDPSLEVPSPSYTLVQSYATRIGPVHHLDLWRLTGPSELVELGWEELLDDVVLVEWAERLGTGRPSGALTVALQLEAGTRRAWLDGWEGRL